ncbi:MAG: Non-ous end joining protein Ku, partial [Marmoricola sp.]|nr:Non-ous end joining protein Ku [Marmoricola sp.]
AKGYETEDGEMVILTDDDMASLPMESSREISVEKFVPSEQIDPMLFEKSYYLEPEKTGAKPYALLREALEAADRMALVTVSLRNRTSLAVLRVRDDVIVMQTMMWPDEIRTPDFGSVDTSQAKPAEVKMAQMLVETLAGDFDADDYEDDYREALAALVKAKVEGGEVTRTPTSTKTSGEVVDLLAALQRSVDAARTARGEKPAAGSDGSGDAEEAAESEEAADEPASGSKPTKKTAKKTPAKKSAAKKTPAKKAS